MLCQVLCFYVLAILQLQAVTTGGSIIGIISKDVVLPCKFQPTQISEVVLHWMRIAHPTNIVVHSFYRGKDQLLKQDQSYRGRTMLFENEIMRGNASLQLSRINKNDEGKYQCYISLSKGKQEIDILLQVAAHWKNATLYPPNMLSTTTEVINIVCSAFGVYPKPLLVWQDDNENNLTQNANLEVATDPQGLFNVKSMLKINQTSDMTYKCNIKNERMQQSWNATWKMKGRLNTTESETIIITCDDFFNFDQNVTITWRFRKTETSPSTKICKSVQQQGNVNTNCPTTQSEMPNTQKFSSLVLQNVTPNISGEYTCEISTKDAVQVFTYILIIDSGMQNEPPSYRQHFAVMASFAVFIVLQIGLLFGYKKETEKEEERRRNLNPMEISAAAPALN